jgi:hypothetical protein
MAPGSDIQSVGSFRALFIGGKMRASTIGRASQQRGDLIRFQPGHRLRGTLSKNRDTSPRQKEIVAEMENDGHADAAQSARELLATFEWTQQSHLADRDRARAELANCK